MTTPPDHGAVFPPLPARPSKRYVRMLSYEGIDGPALKFALRAVSLDDEPVFAAVSYWWGPNSGSCHVELNGRRFGVTDNLYNLLKLLRARKMRYMLWVDALCINQADEVEKGQQIGLMRDIYSSAKLVLAWLGEPDRFDDNAAYWLHRLARAYENFIKSWKEDSVGQEFDKISSAEHFSECGFPEWTGSDLDIYDDVIEIYLRPEWHRRIWVVQEVTLAKKALILYGKYIFDFPLLFTGWKGLYRALQVTDAFRISTLDKADFIGIYKISEGWRNNDSDFPKIIAWLRRAQASDPRDRIFGLLGLLPRSSSDGSEGELSLSANYTLNVQEVFTDAAVKLIRYYKDLEILHTLRHPGMLPLQHLPSWVPDFREIGKEEACSMDPISILDYERDRACASKQSRCNPQLRRGMLKLEGMVLDIIISAWKTPLSYRKEAPSDIEEHIVTSKEPQRSLEILFEDFQARLFGLDLEPTGQKYITGEDLDVAYVRAVTFDTVPKRAMFAWQKSVQVRSRHLKMILKGMKLLETKGFGDETSEDLKEIIDTISKEHQQKMLDLFKVTPEATERWHSMAPAISARGYLVMAPWNVEMGDIVIICKGGRLPFLMQETPSGNKLKGACFVHGVMYGEAWNDKACEDMWFV